MARGLIAFSRARVVDSEEPPYADLPGRGDAVLVGWRLLPRVRCRRRPGPRFSLACSPGSRMTTSRNGLPAPATSVRHGAITGPERRHQRPDPGWHHRRTVTTPR